MGTFVGGIGLAGVAARALDRNPACQTPLDFAVLSARVVQGRAHARRATR